MIIVEDKCAKKAFVTVNVATTTCTCQNNGTCTFEPNQQHGGGKLPMRCQCEGGYSGSNCELSP